MRCGESYLVRHFLRILSSIGSDGFNSRLIMGKRLATPSFRVQLIDDVSLLAVLEIPMDILTV